MRLYLEKEDLEKEIKIDSEKSLKQILKEEKISISSVILVKNGEVCLEDEMVNDKDEVKLLSVVSGG